MRQNPITFAERSGLAQKLKVNVLDAEKYSTFWQPFFPGTFFAYTVGSQYSELLSSKDSPYSEIFMETNMQNVK